MERSEKLCALAISLLSGWAFAGPYSPAAGQPGSTAIAASDSRIVAWASGFTDLVRGPQNVSVSGSPLASAGSGSLALGPATGSSGDIVSLGDGGRITLTFDQAMKNGAGADFAVFENGFGDAFLELAFVEVSSNGVNFFRFPSISLTPTDAQVGSFGSLDPTNLHNLAGSFRAGFGTPFDLEDLVGVSPLLDVNNVGYVRIVDVIGTIDPLYGSVDSLGNFVNDPFPTAFASGGFDLEAVGAIHVVPEASALLLASLASGAGAIALACRRRNRG